MMSCSHCYRAGHTKRACPHAALPAEEARENERRERTAFFSAANVIAEILGAYPPEARVRLALEGFQRSDYHYARAVEAPLREREATARELVKAELHHAIVKKDAARKATKEPKVKAKPTLLN
jgi:hypothetical protein